MNLSEFYINDKHTERAPRPMAREETDRFELQVVVREHIPAILLPFSRFRFGVFVSTSEPSVWAISTGSESPTSRALNVNAGTDCFHTPLHIFSGRGVFMLAARPTAIAFKVFGT
jgi:hypothetical protein